MTEDANPPKILLPRLRVPSLSFTDISQSNHTNSLRNISSSTSLLSTPSNNIRRVQQINGTKPKDVLSRPRKTGPIIPKGAPSKTAATRKLLNLQELKRSQAVVRPFVLRKPADLSEYDYSVFAHKLDTTGDSQDTESSLRIKESQVRAWESAEKVSANVIFDTETSTGEDVEIFEDYNNSMEINSSDEDASFDGLQSADRERSIVLSIPNYTKGELKILQKHFDALQNCRTKIDIINHEGRERQALAQHREHQRIVHERASSSNSKPLFRRKLQVFRKKEFLHCLFGYSNNINNSYITNNTAYSAFDNVLNATKAYQEDHDETVNLLKMEEDFVALQAEIKDKITSEKSMPKNDAAAPNGGGYESLIETLDLLNMTNSWLTASYDYEMSHHDGQHSKTSDANQDILTYTLAYLKSRVREET